MKEKIPDYRLNPIEGVFIKFSKENKKIIEDFLKYCKITSSQPKTSDKIKRKIVAFCDTIEKDLSNLNLEDLREFLGILRASDKSRDYKLDLMKQIKRFLRWKYDDHPKRFNRFQEFDSFTKMNKKVDKLRNEDLYTPKEINDIIKQIYSLKYKTLISVLYESGARPEEIVNLKLKDINFNRKTIYVYSNKTQKGREIPLNNSMSHLKRFKQEGFVNISPEDYIFRDRKNNPKKQMTTSYLGNYFAKIQDSLKLPKRFYPYILRHSRLQILRKTLSPDTYEAVSGHSLIVASQYYKHLDLDGVLDEMNSKVYEVSELTKEEKNELETMKEEFEEFKKEMLERESMQDKFIKELLREAGFGKESYSPKEKAETKKQIEFLTEPGVLELEDGQKIFQARTNKELKELMIEHGVNPPERI